MNELVFLLEEYSAQVMLEGLLPRVLPSGMHVRYIVFDGKSDLERRLVNKLRNYRVPNARFVVLRDKDAADCRIVKDRLVKMCREANRPEALVRIACHELESWYLADLQAVEEALQIRGLSDQKDKKKFRDPDLIAGAADELGKLTQGRYQKVGGSRKIGKYLRINNSRSRSFAVFIAGIRRIAGIC